MDMNWLQFMTQIIIPINLAMVGFILWVRRDIMARQESDHQLAMKEVDRRMNIIEENLKTHLQANHQSTTAMLDKIRTSLETSVQNQSQFQFEIIRSYTPKAETEKMEMRCANLIKEVESRLIAAIERMDKSITAFKISKKQRGDESHE